MSRATQIGKKRTRWVVVAIIIIAFVIGSIWLIRKNILTSPNQKEGDEYVFDGADEQFVLTLDEDAEYAKIEELFPEQKDVMQDFIDELSNLDMLRDETYYIVFDEDRFKGRPAGGDCIHIVFDKGTFILDLFCNGGFPKEEMDELEQILNENTSLIELLNSISDQEVITSIRQICDGGILMTKFEIDTNNANEIFKFDIDTNGRTILFMYCEDESVEKYGYRNIEDNWYMYITPQMVE